MKKSVLFLSFIILTQANPLCAMYDGHHKGHKSSGPRTSILKAAIPLLTLATILSLIEPTSGCCPCHNGYYHVSCCPSGSCGSGSSGSSSSDGSQAYAQQLARDYEARNRADAEQRRLQDYLNHIQEVGRQQGYR